MLPTYKKQNILIRSFSYLPPWYRLEKATYPTTTAGTEWKEFGLPEIPALLCTRPLFYYLAPYVLMFTNAVTEHVFLLFVEAPTIIYAQKLSFYIGAHNAILIRDTTLTPEQVQAAKLLTRRALSALHKITYLQDLVISRLDLEETRLVAIEQIGQLHRLESLHWLSLGYSPSPFSTKSKAQFPLLLLIAGGCQEGEGKPESTAKFLAAVPLVKFNMSFAGEYTEFNFVLSQISRTLRRLHLGVCDRDTWIDREVLDIIATNCPQLTHLKVANVFINDELSLEPFQRLCRLKNLSISTISGFEKNSPLSQVRNQTTSVISRLHARSDEQAKKCQRSLRFLRACSGELEELSIVNTIFGSDLSIASLFGFPSEQLDDKGDDESGGRRNIDPTERSCTWPRLTTLELSLPYKKSLCYFDSTSFPSLTSFRIANDAHSFYCINRTGLCIDRNDFNRAFASLVGLKKISLPALLWDSKDSSPFDHNDGGVCLLEFLTRAAASSSSSNRSQNENDDYDERSGESWSSWVERTEPRPTCVADSLQEFTIAAMVVDGRSESSGFTAESVNKFLQRRTLSSFGRHLNKLDVGCAISDEFIRLISEDKNLQRTLEDLTLGRRDIETESFVTDDGIFHLRHLSNVLRHLTLSTFVAITDEGAANVVQHLVHLKSLNLPNCCLVGDLVCSALQNHYELDSLDLLGTAVTGTTFPHLKQCLSLNYLILSSCSEFKDIELLAPLNQVTALGYLELSNSHCFAKLDFNHNKKLMSEICERILLQAVKRGCYVNGGF